MVRMLLSRREDIVFDYSKEAFLRHLEENVKITQAETVSSTGRFLVSYERRL
jgi:hypothetical protein